MPTLRQIHAERGVGIGVDEGICSRAWIVSGRARIPVPTRVFIHGELAERGMKRLVEYAPSPKDCRRVRRERDIGADRRRKRTSHRESAIPACHANRVCGVAGHWHSQHFVARPTQPTCNQFRVGRNAIRSAEIALQAGEHTAGKRAFFHLANRLDNPAVCIVNGLMNHLTLAFRTARSGSQQLDAPWSSARLKSVIEGECPQTQSLADPIRFQLESPLVGFLIRPFLQTRLRLLEHMGQFMPQQPESRPGMGSKMSLAKDDVIGIRESERMNFPCRFERAVIQVNSDVIEIRVKLRFQPALQARRKWQSWGIKNLMNSLRVDNWRGHEE